MIRFVALCTALLALASSAHAQTQGNAAADFTLPCLANVPWVGQSSGTVGKCWSGALGTGAAATVGNATGDIPAVPVPSGDLATTGITPGTYGSGTAIPQITFGPTGQATGIAIVNVVQGALPGALNVAETLTSAATSTIVTADQVVMCTALGGTCYAVGSYSQTFNGSTTGAGGMDSGSLPSSGWLALYAIYNPASGVVAILGTSCASACGTIYGGTNMPSGFTASVRLTVLPTNSTPEIVAQWVIGKSVYYATIVSVLTSSSTSVSCTSLSLSAAVPIPAVGFSVVVDFTAGTSPTAGSYYVGFFGNSTCTQYGGVIKFYIDDTFTRTQFLSDIPLLTTQGTFYSLSNTGTSPSIVVYVVSYRLP